jgi:hypothetical protein
MLILNEYEDFYMFEKITGTEVSEYFNHYVVRALKQGIISPTIPMIKLV